MPVLLAAALLGALPFLPREEEPVRQVVAPVVSGAPEVFAASGETSEEKGFEPDMVALGDRLREVAEGHKGFYGMVVYDPRSRQEVALNAGERFRAASLGKLPTLIALYRGASAGELDLEESLVLRPEDVQSYGTGVLHGAPVGTELSLRTCARHLMKDSDNTAWVMLEKRLGAEKIERETRAAGAHATDYHEYTTTPQDVLSMLRKISDPAFTSEDLSRDMLDSMTDTAFEDRLPGRLPEDVRVAHKIGSYEDTFGDAGIVYFEDAGGTERHYFVVVIATGTDEHEARDAIQEASLAAYEEIALPQREQRPPKPAPHGIASPR